MDLYFSDKLFGIFKCPETKQPLTSAMIEEDEKITQYLITEGGKYKYPVKNGVPRFVSAENYASNFGMQWNKFAKTQLDSFSNTTISHDRFWDSTGWKPEDLQDKWVLDLGCGSGRFAEVALKAGAYVVALEYSVAIDACNANLSEYDRFIPVQGDIYNLPFEESSFDFVYSLGVLQHTPDVAKAFNCSANMVKHVGGNFCVDFYCKSFWSIFLPKYWLRPITKNVNPTTLFEFLEKTVRTLLLVSNIIGYIPIIGHHMRRIVPVANFRGVYDLSPEQHFEWSLLDTFDWLAPAYDSPQTVSTVEKWMKSLKFKNHQVFKSGHLIGRGSF